MSVLIIGSGPAAVAAARPLLEAGHAVTLVTAGAEPDPAPRARWWKLRAEALDGWKVLQGEDARIWAAAGNVSPKLRTPRAAALFNGFAEALSLEEVNFSARGALAVGGLSRSWGAGVACFDADDLAGTALDAADLAPHYAALAARIGVSGAEDDLAAYFGRHPLLPPPPLAPPAEALARGYRRTQEGFRQRGLRLGRGRNAVLTEDRPDRNACALCATCLWGCGEGAIWSADLELAALRRFPGLRVLTGLRVESLRQEARGWLAEARDEVTREPVTLAAPRVLLAAGAIGSARLVREALGLHGAPGPLLSNPTSAFALWLPRLLGAAQPRDAFALAQLSVTIEGPGDSADAAFGNLFQLSGLPASEFMMRLPLSAAAGRRVLRALMPGMLVGNLFLPGALSRHSLTLRSDGGLTLAGGCAPELEGRLRDARRRLAPALLPAGALLLPGGFEPGEPGSDLHYAGTVPMRSHPAHGESDPMGEVVGLPGVHVVDAAALPVLPAKAHSFTVMANAARVAERLARA